MTDEDHDTMIRQGVRRLRDWLPAARAEAARGDLSYEVLTALARAQAPYITEENLWAALIYPDPNGGWHVDVLLRNVPPGVSNTLGTPMDKPKSTREEAEALGRTILVLMLAQAQQNRDDPKPAPPPAFLLYGWSISLSPELYQKILERSPDAIAGYGSQQIAAEHIEAVLAAFAPDGFDGASFDLWPLEQKSMLLAVLHMAALSGLMRYPRPLDAAHPGEGEPSQARH